MYLYGALHCLGIFDETICLGRDSIACNFLAVAVYEKKRFVPVYCKIIGMHHSGNVFDAFARINEECYFLWFGFIADCRAETVGRDRKTIVYPG